ncbi:MAG: RsmD family RNA methyltransferase [Candidatus Saccharibacteria bacterium]|nr:RsmD family RNA methyltransferase [Candidatus Saccharibacteria bacterium]
MKTVRITSGNYKGKVLATPGEGTHPMGERERIALFNMVGNDLTGANVLDAYAGSGILGAEALSRWAPTVVFVEKSPRAARVIRENLAKMELFGFPNPPIAEVVCGDVRKYRTDLRFRLIIADPPYDDFDLAGVEHLTKFLAPEGVLALSHPGEAPGLPGLELEGSHQYARAHLSVYVKR